MPNGRTGFLTLTAVSAAVLLRMEVAAEKMREVAIPGPGLGSGPERHPATRLLSSVLGRGRRLGVVRAS